MVLALRISDFLGAEAAKKLTHFVLARQKQDGGFGLTPRLPATVEDTYYAVRILELLGEDETLTRTRDYLERLDWSISRRARTTYALVYLRRKFACPIICPPRPSGKSLQVLEEAYYWQKIARICKKKLRFRLSSLTLPKNPIIRDVHYYLALKGHFLTPAEAAHWAEWVQACQTPAGGFGFKPGTTAFMDNVLPALEICRLLGCKPLNLSRLTAFILACQTRAGGFARSGGGVAFLESSYQAVKSLWLIQENFSRSS